jgi:transcriptional regulator with XRE-family HTH domain
MAEDPDPASAALSPLLRRIRRAADCSQRELARRLGISATAVAQAETGTRDLPTSVLVRAAELAGLRVGLLDTDGREVPGMAPDAVRDRSGRHYPAHLDTRYGDQLWWHGQRYTRVRPWYTFDRRRDWRDAFRTADGTPPDHQVPRPGDSPQERAWARQEAARAARTERAARAQEAVRERWRRGIFEDLDPTCNCPPECEELLFPSAPLPARLNAVPHVEDCPCRCDIA